MDKMDKTEVKETTSDAGGRAPARTREQGEDRKERIPFGAPKGGFARFRSSAEKGYTYRIFNANWRHDPDRIQRAEDAGWQIVGDQRNVTVSSNEDGSAVRGILMRIPEELYAEDQAAKQKQLDAVDEQIHGGKFQEQPGEKRYVPPPGIQTEVRSEP